MEENYDKEYYNSIPVFFCTRCLSLHIRMLDEGDYCEKCGSTSIDSGEINEWEKIYKERHEGKKFIDSADNGDK